MKHSTAFKNAQQLKGKVSRYVFWGQGLQPRANLVASYGPYTKPHGPIFGPLSKFPEHPSRPAAQDTTRIRIAWWQTWMLQPLPGPSAMLGCICSSILDPCNVVTQVNPMSDHQLLESLVSANALKMNPVRSWGG